MCAPTHYDFMNLRTGVSAFSKYFFSWADQIPIIQYHRVGKERDKISFTNQVTYLMLKLYPSFALRCQGVLRDSSGITSEIPEVDHVGDWRAR